MFEGEAAEETKLDEFGLLRVFNRELGEGFIEGLEVGGEGLNREVFGFEFDAVGIAAALHGVTSAGVIDEDPAHRFGGGAKEVTLRFEGSLAGQAQVGFVNESSGVKGVAGGFAGHLGGGEAA